MSIQHPATPFEAMLVMDTAVHHNPNSGSWSKLYKMHGFYLDLSHKVNESGRSLIGQVMSPKMVSDGSIRVLDRSGQVCFEVLFGNTGMFRLGLEDLELTGLEVCLAQERFVVRLA